MSYDSCVAAIVARFEASWTTTAIRLPNDTTDRPIAGDGSPLPFAYLEVIGGTDEQMSIGAPGNNLFRRRGTIVVHLFVPRGSGDGTALGYAVGAGDIFRAQTFGGLTCEGASIGGGETADDNGLYWRRSVSIPFWEDEAA